MSTKSPGDRDFHALSIKDLLDAREAYHVHLAHKPNVFATAVGLFLIRDEDPDAKDPARPRESSDEPRTLRNASHRRWSWPCILVFVNEWQERAAFAREPDAMVPRFLYLPDGRVIPTCVVAAGRKEAASRAPEPPAFPSDLLGGGYPALADVQGQRRLSSIGCLVTDGDATYALTNRHVAGPAGREILTRVAGREQRIGVSAGRELGKRSFPDVYRGWQGSRVLVNLDVGLVRIDDVNTWTAQVFGVGELGSVWDLDIDSFNLDLIGCPVRAHGAASGQLEGQIQALFYRYKSVGGIEYVTDLMIGPRKGADSVGTRPGDSGTVWFEDVADGDGARGDLVVTKAPRLRPLALQWGAQSILSPGATGSAEYALASCLSTVCRELDVDIMADWNAWKPETWGAVGHFKIGALACELVADPWLRAVMLLNQANIGVEDQKLEEGAPDYKGGAFVPLADVADFVWRNTRHLDSSNHFADMDQEAEEGRYKGQTLLSLTRDHDNVDPEVWNAFYESLGEDKRGALPFRVWQIVDEMVGYAREGKLLEFVCAGGLMAHYVGDACQPLHVSKYHHGIHKEEKRESGVHSAYETNMLNSFAEDLFREIARSKGPRIRPVVGGGRAAAIAVVELMRRTVELLPPIEVVEAYNTHHGRDRLRAMWDQLGKRTAERILDGATVLARIWEGAWTEGAQGRPALPTPTTPYSHEELANLYNDRDFVPSHKLQDIVREGDALKSRAEAEERGRRRVRQPA